MHIKEWMGFLSLVIGAIQYGPYCWSTFKNKIRPHAFSYYIWGLSAGVVFVAQYVSAGGAGSWAMALSAVACCLVAILSSRNGMGYITRGDWVALVIALASIVLWVVTKNPLSAVILITLVDGMAYLPTLRKVYTHPREDVASTYMIGWAKHFVSLLALENYNFTTILAPVFIIVANTTTIVLLFWRRRSLIQSKADIL